MSFLPNHKARLSRAVRNNLPTYSAFQTFKRSQWFIIAGVILFPIYPSLAALGNPYAAPTDYDQSSILFEYTDSRGANSGQVSHNGIVKVDMDDIYYSGDTDEVVTPPDAQAEKEEVPESNVRTYTVVEHDDIIKISKQYNIDPEVILWMNNIDMNGTLIEGQELTIPSVSGVIHTMKKGETLSEIAARYQVRVADIVSANNIADVTKIRDGRKLMVPGAVRPEPPKPAAPAAQQTPKPTTTARATTQAPAPVAVAASAPAPADDAWLESTTPAEPQAAVMSQAAAHGLKESYTIKYTGNGRGFVAGNCTWHVAAHKTVTWRGNANQWIKNAKAKGVPTGKIPVPGAIVQFTGHGYHPTYGHVGIVTEVRGNTIIVSDMNYSGLYKVTVREVSINDPAIDGYIYVD